MTILRFTTSSSVPSTPSVHSVWDDTAPTDFVRRVMSESDSGTTSDQEVTAYNTPTVGDNLVQLQYVSDKKLRAQTISGSYDLTTSQFANPFGAVKTACHIRVITSSEATRGVLSNRTAESASTVEPAASYGTMTISDSFSSVACQDGDYLVVEIGYDVYATGNHDMGTRAGSGTLDMTDTILWLEPPTNLTYLYTSSTTWYKDAVTNNTATYTNNGGTHTFSIASGSLPTGLSLDTSTGTISGAPTVVGSYPVVIRVANSEGSTDSATITYVIKYRPVSTLRMDKIGRLALEM